MDAEAVEALAKSLAVKLEMQKRALGDNSDELIRLKQEDAEYKRAELEFKKELRGDIAILMNQRVHLPRAALAISLLAMLLSLVTLVGTARAGERVAAELAALRASSAAAPKVPVAE